MSDEKNSARPSKKPYIVLVIGLLAVIVSAVMLTPKLWHRIRYPATADGQMLAVYDRNLTANDGRISKKVDPKDAKTYFTVNDEGGFGVRLIETDDPKAAKEYYKGNVFVKIYYDPADTRKYVIEYNNGNEWYLYIALFCVGAVMTFAGAVSLKRRKVANMPKGAHPDENSTYLIPLRAKKAFLVFEAVLTVTFLTASLCLWVYYKDVRDNYTAEALALPEGLSVIDQSGSFKPARNGQESDGIKKKYVRLKVKFDDEGKAPEYVYTDDLDYLDKNSTIIVYDPDDPQDWCIDEKRDSYRLYAIILVAAGAVSGVITAIMARYVSRLGNEQSAPQGKPKRKRKH